MRLLTSPRVFRNPDPAADVVAFLDVLLEPPTALIYPGPTHWRRFCGLCRELSLRGNLVPDAYLAALAIEQSASLITLDRGFSRYPGLRCRLLDPT